MHVPLRIHMLEHIAAGRGGQTGRTGTPRTEFLTARNHLNTGRFETDLNRYRVRAEYGLGNEGPNRNWPGTAKTRGTVEPRNCGLNRRTAD